MRLYETSGKIQAQIERDLGLWREDHDEAQSRSSCGAEPAQAGLCATTELEMAGRHHLHLHMGRVVLSGNRPGPVQSEHRRLGHVGAYDGRPDSECAENGLAVTSPGLGPCAPFDS